MTGPVWHTDPAMPATDHSSDADDPVLVRRARIARAVSIGLRLGYGLFAVALVVFFLGLFTRLTDTHVGIILACLGIGSIVLAPAIVFNYAVRAAIRDEQESAT